MQRPRLYSVLDHRRRMSFNKNEALLQEQVKRNPPPRYTKLYKQEYHVVPGQTHCGVGDLIFVNQNNPNKFLVVETKYENPLASAKTNKTKRQRAKQQARFYSDRLKEQFPGASVRKAIYTNKRGLEYLKD